jgi:uncharacterized protein YqeY
MSIQQKIDEELKAAMRAKDAQKLVAIRMVKAKMGETITAKGFSGTVDDALWLSGHRVVHQGPGEGPRAVRGRRGG